jgi:hypothetical protein
MKPWAAAFVRRLAELGWNEGRTVAIQTRWADGHVDRFPEVAALEDPHGLRRDRRCVSTR